MNIFEAIKTRRSYRGEFLDKKVDRETLEKIVKAGIEAPSGCNAQTTKFIIIDDIELVKKINLMHQGNNAMKTAKAFIACYIDKNPLAVYKNMSFQKEDCAAAVENMLLAITGLELASVWIDGWLKSDNNAEKIASIVNLPSEKTIDVLLPIGFPKEKNISSPPKLSFNERVSFNNC